MRARACIYTRQGIAGVSSLLSTARRTQACISVDSKEIFLPKIFWAGLPKIFWAGLRKYNSAELTNKEHKPRAVFRFKFCKNSFWRYRRGFITAIPEIEKSRRVKMPRNARVQINQNTMRFRFFRRAACLHSHNWRLSAE